MSRQSAAGKQAWQRRAPGYGAELRTEIERQSAKRFEAWQSRGRLALWLRIKRRLPLWLRAQRRLPRRLRAMGRL
jgi:hypothetical protein